MIAYKLCSIVLGSGAEEFGSWSTVVRMNIQTPLQYEIGKTTTPNYGDGPLCAFRDLGSAREYMHDYSPLEAALLESEVEESETFILLYRSSGGVMKSLDFEIPEGTIYCKSITPHKRVW